MHLSQVDHFSRYGLDALYSDDDDDAPADPMQAGAHGALVLAGGGDADMGSDGTGDSTTGELGDAHMLTNGATPGGWVGARSGLRMAALWKQGSGLRGVS